jgi:hypothetical protein
MTDKPADRREPDVMGDPEPDEEGTDIMAGRGPGEHADVMDRPESDDRPAAS